MPDDTPTFRLALVPGVVPRRWERVWAELVRRPRLEVVPVEEHEQVAVLAERRARMVLARLPLVPAAGLAVEDLHVVRAYEERPVLLAPRDHLLAATGEDEEVALEDVADELLGPGDLPPGTPAAARVASVAAGHGLLVVPYAVARAHRRSDVLVRTVVGPGPTTVALVWPRAEDDGLTQQMVGVVRGRTARSSR